jgi:hypothetical protein
MVTQLKEDKARAEKTVEKQAAELTVLKAELNELASVYKEVCSHYAVGNNTASVGVLLVLLSCQLYLLLLFRCCQSTCKRCFVF